MFGYPENRAGLFETSATISFGLHKYNELVWIVIKNIKFLYHCPAQTAIQVLPVAHMQIALVNTSYSANASRTLSSVQDETWYLYIFPFKSAKQ